MLTSEIIRKYPVIYHMAHIDSWPIIKQHGLLSTSALLDKWGYIGQKREEIECKLRPAQVCIFHEKYGKAVIRDQKAMDPEQLTKSLPKDISIADWCKFINKRVFFWADWIGLRILISAKEYVYKPHLVISIDTSKLLKKYENKVTLSPINSGSTFPKKGRTDPEPRSYATFKNISEYTTPWITELAVDYGIPDILDYAICCGKFIQNKKDYNSEPDKLEEVWHS